MGSVGSVCSDDGLSGLKQLQLMGIQHAHIVVLCVVPVCVLSLGMVCDHVQPAWPVTPGFLPRNTPLWLTHIFRAAESSVQPPLPETGRRADRHGHPAMVL